MPLLEIDTHIQAPIDRVFDLTRSIDAHLATSQRNHERAAAGRTTGLIGLGETVTWEAKHFGIRQRMTVKITSYDRPNFFRDELTEGPFLKLRHVHRFSELSTGTLMKDEFFFLAPMGPLGRIAEKIFLTTYMSRFLLERADALKRLAESDAWREFLCRR